MSLRAPGGPGSIPKWTSTDKTGAGTALWSSSQVWFTISHGILNEVFYPGVDVACVRDIGLIVTDGAEFFSEEKRDAISEVALEADGVPAWRLTNRCRKGRYEIHKHILTDPRRNVLLQKTRFVPLRGDVDDFRLYLLVAPHIGNSGVDNTAWVGDFRGLRMLFAQRGEISLAVACSVPWLGCSVGFVGISDGWQDLTRHRRLTWSFELAEVGNVALTGEVDLKAKEAREGFVLAVGFGASPEEAGVRVVHSFLDGFESARRTYVTGWQQLQDGLLPLDVKAPRARDLFRVSATLLRIHEDKRFPGSVIPSLSIPWGLEKGAASLGDYHVVWPRDLAWAAGGLVAAGSRSETLRILHYLYATQEPDGHWPQSMAVDGHPLWNSPQMDEAALVVLLFDLARRNAMLDEVDEMERLWRMVVRAVTYICRNGPVLQEDRTDRDVGFSPWTLAAEVAALLAAAEMMDARGETSQAEYLRETADAWNDEIEHWTYVRGTDLCQWVGVDGYYVRISSHDEAPFSTPRVGLVANRVHGESQFVVTPDALALVRFGLRAPDDPRMLDTLRVVDEMLKVDTPNGPSWHRFSNDRYGEYDDGSSFDGNGVGRAWPLLTGERAHFELAAGRPADAEELARAMEAFASAGGMLPEQVWDADDVASSTLTFGRPTGSAMPHMWTHAEYLKLRRSLHDGRVFDMPPQTVARYQRDKTVSRHAIWRFNHKAHTLPAGRIVRIETLAPAEVHWTVDGWATRHKAPSRAVGMDVYVTDVPPLKPAAKLEFTFFWPNTENWEGKEFTIRAR